jgi:opacity protein-like surface antigen
MRLITWKALFVVLLLTLASTAGFAAGDATWTGFYVGATIANARHMANWTDTSYDWFGGTLTHPYDSAQWGATVGYNQESNGVVYGVEFDYSGGSKKNEVIYDTPNNTESGISVLKTDKLKSIFTLRARAGIPVGHALFYLTAGLAQPKAEHTWIETGDVPDSWPTFTNSKIGYAYGFGFEHKIGANWSWKIEYLNIKNKAERSTNANTYYMDVDENVDLFRIGVNIKF